MDLEMKQFGFSIYFSAESDQKQKFDVKSRNCFIPSSNILKAVRLSLNINCVRRCAQEYWVTDYW